ncbi:Cell division protein FtsH [hydrothermal vent metagenome]|uniref:Cell division protein FtsH n=1 Tax=hydrothermal vent metagenome TaxID=652676 RepID=A0A3B0RJX4_9ZZZZ
MRFVLRPGTSRTAKADPTLLATLGLPGGGVVKVGKTHVRVAPAEMSRLNELEIPQSAFDNGAGAPGDAVSVERAVVPNATSVGVRLEGSVLDIVPGALLGVPVTARDRYRTDEGTIEIVEVSPASTAVVTASTLARAPEDRREDVLRPTEDSQAPATSVLTAGLDNEYELLAGWLQLLLGDRPNAPQQRVAGIVVSGPPGCGKGELVAAACSDLGYRMTTIDLRTVTTPDRLLAKFERAIKGASPRSVLYVKRLDHLIAREGGIRHQTAAVTRWLLDTAADVTGVTVVIGTRLSDLPETLDARELLPRTLTIAPPDRKRRKALFDVALGRTVGLDTTRLANATPGFSALDISSAVLAARAAVPGEPTTEDVLDAIGSTTPSLGTSTLGDIPSYGFDKVANLVDVKRTLTETVIWQLREPERFERMGIEPPRGILLYGPPGTGKTYVMRALAHESGAAFFTIKGAELLDKWVGESERGVREVFARARALAPAIVFFDELDALAPQRGRSTNTVTDSVVAALLTELDGVGSRGDVFVVGATNRKDLIDPALLRPGRLEVHLFLDVPEPSAREAFFMMTSVPFDEGVEISELVAITDGFSFADLDGVLRAAAIRSLRDDALASMVSMTDLRGAVTDRRAQRPKPSDE